MITKGDLIQSISNETGVGRADVKKVLDDLAAAAAEHLATGEDFIIPGLVKLSWAYRAPQAKGAKYKKGDTYTGFGGAVIESAEADSKPVTERVLLKASLTGDVAKLKPGQKPDAQKAFLASKTGKAVRARKKK